MSASNEPASAEVTLEVEACSLRAWPGAEEERLEGWHLRATGGYTRRANSANPLGDPGSEVPAAVAHVHAWFAARGLPAVFKITASVRPPGLDEFLERAGWRHVAPSRVMTADVVGESRPALPSGLELVLEDDPAEAWLAAFARWHDLSPGQAAAHRSIVTAIRPDRTLARVVDPEGATRSVGLAVADGRWVGLFDLVTDPALRSRGIGRAVVAALRAWGADRGALRAYLQVEERNEAARRLYGVLGFRSAHAYWYRVAPESPGRAARPRIP